MSAANEKSGGLPAVSVLIPTYNYAEFLPQAIESALAQTVKPMEIVVADDGSTDDTAEVVAGYGEAVKYRRFGHVGVYAIRQAMLSELQGEWFLNLDADDWIEPDFLEKALAVAMRNGGDRTLAFVYPDIRHFGEADDLVEWPEFSVERLKRGNYIVMSSLIRLDAARLAGFDPQFNDGWGDYDLFLSLVERGFRGERLPGGLMHVRVHSKSISGKVRSRFRHGELANKILAKHSRLFSEKEARTLRGIARSVAVNQMWQEAEKWHADGQCRPALALRWQAIRLDWIPPRKGSSRVLSPLYAGWRMAATLAGLVFGRPRPTGSPEVAVNAAGCPGRLGGTIRGLCSMVRGVFETVRRFGVLAVAHMALAILRQSGLRGLWVRIRAGGRADGRNDYAEWVRRFDCLDEADRRRIRERLEGMARRPLVSVLLPVFNPDPAWLDEAIKSVRGQLYPDWELCIADDASTDPRIRPLLERHAGEDPRIKVVFRPRNGHISAASNSALALATGEWAALLDHDDRLAEHALYWVARTAVEHPEAALIYSDEDKIDGRGERSEPYFKCDWNPDLFLSHNMICHLGVYRRAVVEELGGFREGFEGAQDYDLALRVTEKIPPAAIRHIPRVLYHWRMHGGSTARSADSKPYAAQAANRALNEHFQRMGIRGRVELEGEAHRARYDLPDPPPLATIIIPFRNGRRLLQTCIESIRAKTTYFPYEMWLVDNGSDEPETLAYLKELQQDPRLRVIRDDRPFNYSALNNMAVRVAQGEFVVLLNNDIEVISPDWLSEMISLAMRPGMGAVGARLWYPDGTLQHGGIIVGIGGVAGHAHKGLPRGMPGYFGRATLLQSVSAVTGACMVVRRQTYLQVGGLDEANLSVAFNDVDFGLKLIQAGCRNIWTPYAELVHHESKSRGYEDDTKKRWRFFKEMAFMKQKWGAALLNDPAYSPNLTLDHEDFSLAWPPRVERD